MRLLLLIVCFACCIPAFASRSDTGRYADGRLRYIERTRSEFWQAITHVASYNIYFDSLSGDRTESGKELVAFFGWGNRTGRWKIFEHNRVRAKVHYIWGAPDGMDSTFYDDGRLAVVRRHIRRGAGSFVRANTFETDFDSSTGRITACGKAAIWGRQGRWRFYEQGALSAVKRYRYGWLRDSLHLPGRKRFLVYYNFGWGGGRYQGCDDSAFGMVHSPIAFCMVSQGEIIRAWEHNAVNDVIQLFRFGFGWRSRYNKMECF